MPVKLRNRGGKLLILRLILGNLQSPFGKITRALNRRLFIYTFLVMGVFAVCSVSVAEAGFFSFLNKILGNGGREEKIEVVKNSQTVLLLQSVLNSNPAAGQGGGGISVMNNNALLPDTGPLGSVADIGEGAANSVRISVYVVREGDSLSQIAGMFNVSVNTIVWANALRSGDLIQTGQTLIILPVTGVKYTVEKGDTLSSIAKKYKGDTEEILRYNDLASADDLVVGEEIIIPDGEASYTPVYSGRSNPARGTGGPSYVGYYMRPIEGGVNTRVTASNPHGLHGYNAVDLASYCGAPIFASASGDVIISRSYGWNGGYGNYIVISHSNGTQTLYAHLSKNIVSVGWHVVQGQVIGYEGSTGNSTGCHVHFEIRGAMQPF